MQAAQEGGAVTIPGGVQRTAEMWHWGMWLVGMVGMGWGLDRMILWVFSNLNDSMILFYHSMTYSMKS